MSFSIDDALASNAWPFKEAQSLLKRFEKNAPQKGYALFETGYGPSGLPHIGTFGEVFRTTMVRQAFARLSDIPTKLIAFSDDMDGLRKVPDNVPNPDMLSQHLGKALTAIPDPFDTHESFGAHMNNRLQQFLDRFGFDYVFKSSTVSYQNGEFDETLRQILSSYDQIMKVIIPTLGEERAASYSPFMPVCPLTQKVLQVPVLNHNAETGTITYQHPTEGELETPVTGGQCKLQWKADWGMRWAALDVDYEMYGKDLTPSAALSSRICQIIGGKTPTQYVYELFLDDKGQKISKSKGNGISLDEWLRYGTEESLSLYMYSNPRKAKRLYFDVIPKHVDEYYTHLTKLPTQDSQTALNNPVWHLHNGEVDAKTLPVSFGLLLNLASACNPEDASVLWGFISRYAPDANPQTMPHLHQLVEHAVCYYEDFVKPHKAFRSPTSQEQAALAELKTRLEQWDEPADAEALQTLIFEIGRNHGFENMRDWFKAQYEVLLGQSQGPRMGSFIALYGLDETIRLITERT